MTNNYRTDKDLLQLIINKDPSFNTDYINNENFEPPIPLSSDLPLNYQFPIDCLGKTLSQFVNELCRIVGAPLPICAQSVLAAISYAAQAHADIHLFGRSHPISLFFLTVGKSGERKSAVDFIALKVIKDFEEEQQKIYERELDIYNQCLQTSKHPETLIKPRESIILMSEPTYEGLIRSYDQGQASVGLFSDEGGRFIGGHALNEENKIKTITGVSEIWDGSPISRVRQKDGAKKLFGKRLSFHLMLQPKLALGLFNDTDLIDQGFLSRCLTTFPRSTMGNRPFVNENIFESKIYSSYEKKIKTLLEMDKIYKDCHSYALNPPKINLSTGSINIIKAFYQEIESELDEKGNYYEISAFANKAVEHACRLAGVLTIFDNPHATLLDIDNIHNSIEIIRFYLKENLRLFGNPEISLLTATQKENNSHAQVLLDWMIEKSKADHNFKNGEFTLRQIMRFAHRRYRCKEVIQKIMSTLLDYGWIEVVENWKKWKLKNIQ